MAFGMMTIGSVLTENAMKVGEAQMNRKKVINGLEDLKMIASQMLPECYVMTARKQIDDALAILKEQEAVKPRSVSRHGAYPQIQHYCGNCNAFLPRKQKYCSECGRAVKWE